MSGRTRFVSWVCLLLIVLPLAATQLWGQSSGTADKANKASGLKESEAASPSDQMAEETAVTAAARPDPQTRQYMLVASLTIFVLAIFIGFEVITKVPPTLHTPLMSGSNAISGITIVGALFIAGKGLGFGSFLGFIAVILAMINVVGGFLVTHRMLAMFKKR